MTKKFLGAMAALLLLAACNQTSPNAEAPSDEMGPMPVVAGLYDSGPLSSDAEYLSVWFTQEMSNAIAANAAGPEAERIDFDYRSWAIDPEVENIRYAIGPHAEPGHAEVSTRFGYQGIPGGMNLTWEMCRRADGEWRIANVTAIAVSEDPEPVATDPVSLRPLLGLAPIATSCD